MSMYDDEEQEKGLSEILSNWKFIATHALAGATGLAIGLIMLFVGFLPDSWRQFIPEVSLALLGIIILGLASERLYTYKRTRRILARVNAAIEKGLFCFRMESSEEIFQRACILVQRAERSIGATSFGIRDHGNAKGSAEMNKYLGKLAEVAERQKKKRTRFNHTIIYGPGQICKEHMRKRVAAFDKRNVRNALEIYEMDVNWVMDFLIVDKKHLHISFQNRESAELWYGLEFVNQKELVEPIADWFDDLIANDARVKAVFKRGNWVNDDDQSS